MRRCFVHIGTHKTGTTSLQMALSERPSELRARRYLYPLAGRPAAVPHGHHNIAWEVSSDSRHQANHGTIDDLVAEIREGRDDVILSSEDFECSLHHPLQFRAFIRRLQSCDLDVTIIIYFRNEADYIQSLYLEMLHHGVSQLFPEFVEDILREGLFRWQGWIFSLSYDDLLTRLENIAGVDLIVRSYDKALTGSLITDFLSIFDLGPAELRIDHEIRVNERCDIVTSVKLFHQNRTQAPLKASDQRMIEGLFGHLQGVPMAMSDQSRRRVAETFRASGNHRLLKPDVAQFLGLTPAARTEETAKMETIFSADVGHQLRI